MKAWYEHAELQPIPDVFGNVAGLLKASEGKTMTEEAIRDIMTELRSIPQKLKW